VVLAPIIVSPTDGTSSTTRDITFTGTATPDSLVTLFDDASPVATKTANGAGDWTVNLSSVSNGVHLYTATATDQFGNESLPSSTVTITVAAPVVPEVTVVASDASAAEQGTDPATFTITRSGPTDTALTVAYTVAGTATTGTDYLPLTGTTTIPIGQVSETITVTPVDDTDVEASETVEITLTADTTYVVGTPGTDTITITDNDTPTEVTVVASADTFVDERLITTNQGTATTLYSDGGAGLAKQSLIRFDVPGLSGTVTAATLRLWVTNGSYNGPEVFLTDTSWDESTVTWATKPATVPGAIADAGAVIAGEWYEFDVTSAVTGAGTLSFLLSSISTDAMKFSSRETTNPPQLVILFE
jgi:hypothetical protein